MIHRLAFILSVVCISFTTAETCFAGVGETPTLIPILLILYKTIKFFSILVCLLLICYAIKQYKHRKPMVLIDNHLIKLFLALLLLALIIKLQFGLVLDLLAPEGFYEFFLFFVLIVIVPISTNILSRYRNVSQSRKKVKVISVSLITSLFFASLLFFLGSLGAFTVPTLFAMRYCPYLVKPLIDHGIGINNKDYTGQTPLFLALSKKDFSTTKLLINSGAIVNGDINTSFNRGLTLLCFAVNQGDLETTALMIDTGANVNARSTIYHDSSPLHQSGTVTYTPLTLAITNGNSDIAKMLLEKGADVNYRDNFDNTPLIYASLMGHTKMVRILINMNADINSRNTWGKTALMYAASAGHKNIIETLLSAGADINTQDNNGGTALLYAYQKQNDDIVNLLRSYETK